MTKYHPIEELFGDIANELTTTLYEKSSKQLIKEIVIHKEQAAYYSLNASGGRT